MSAYLVLLLGLSDFYLHYVGTVLNQYMYMKKHWHGTTLKLDLYMYGLKTCGMQVSASSSQSLL